MADTKLADLTALTTTSDDDLLYVVDDPAGTPADRKLALSDVFKRGTVTTSSPVIDAAQTWNDGAVTFTGLKFNATDTDSAASSLLMDLQVGGASKFSLFKNGGIAGGAVRFGAADAAAPVAQTLSVQSVVAGTTNTAGEPLTITGSQGTGTGAGGSIIFQVAPAGSSGSAQNALADALNIESTGRTQMLTGATTGIYVNDGGAGLIGFYHSGTRRSFIFGNSLGSLELSSTNAQPMIFTGTTDGFRFNNGSGNVFLQTDAADTLALRNGANAQEFRVYGTTDGTNSEYLSIKSNTGGTFDIGPRRVGTGAAQNGALNATATSGSSLITCLSWGSFGSGFLTTSVGFSGAAAGSYDLGATVGGIGGAFRRLILSEYIETSEMTAPAAPAANGVRIYAEDNGSGKTRLMALFNTLPAVEIAIEP